MVEALIDELELYKKIYADTLSSSKQLLLNDKASILLENSLYLSVFTVFEFFLKNMINNYIVNFVDNNMKFEDLSEDVAKKIFVGQKSTILKILDEKDSENRAYKRYNKYFYQPIDEKILKSEVKFEFLHKSKLEKHYKILFSEFFGNQDYLTNLKINIKGEKLFDINQEETTNAETFLSKYTEKIRNEIAHNNNKFRIDENFTFDDIVDIFIKIMTNMKNDYEKYTNFKLEETDENILANI